MREAWDQRVRSGRSRIHHIFKRSAGSTYTAPAYGGEETEADKDLWRRSVRRSNPTRSKFVWGPTWSGLIWPPAGPKRRPTLFVAITSVASFRKNLSSDLLSAPCGRAHHGASVTASVSPIQQINWRKQGKPSAVQVGPCPVVSPLIYQELVGLFAFRDPARTKPVRDGAPAELNLSHRPTRTRQ